MSKTRFIILILSIMIFISMTVSCTLAEDEKPFTSGLGTTINAYQEYGGWIYYIDYPSCNLYKIKSSGEKKTLVLDDPIHSFTIYEDRIFYTNWKFYLYCANVDGSDDKKLYSLNEELLADGTIRAEKMQIADGWIYALYAGELYKFKTNGSEKTVVKLEFFEDFYIEEDKMYYCSIPLKGPAKGHQKWQIEADGTEPQPLMQEPARVIDYDENWIYYVDDDNHNIYKVSFDGNEKYKIAECNGGNFIKVFGDWICYEQSGEKKGIYKIRKDGSENTCVMDIGDRKIEHEGKTHVIDDRVSYYGVFDQWLLCYWHEISAIKLGDSSETDELTYDIISQWPHTTIYE